MSGKQVCAVVISYHPDAGVLENLAVARPQLDALVVVDNGSTAGELNAIRELSSALDLGLIENGTNLGIAAALNRGVQWAVERGFEFVLLLDQDSAITEGYVSTMLQCFAAHPAGERLAILVPRYVDRRLGLVLPPPSIGTTLEAATTSGSLSPVTLFAQAGWFAEELFIDGVDYEYSLRVRGLGFTIAECVDATLLHSPGTPSSHSFFGSKPFHAANYSAVRRYYQERNKIWVTKRYWRTFLPFCLGQFRISIKDLAKIVLVEDQKLRKLRYVLRGVVDGLLERMGPYQAD